jgi:hypothetical protein
MDKQLLVNRAINILKQDLIAHGFSVGEHRTIPRYIGFRPFPVEVGLVMPDVQRSSRMEESRRLDQRIRTLLTDEEQKLIGIFLLYPTADAMNEDMDERLGQHLVVSDW